MSIATSGIISNHTPVVYLFYFSQSDTLSAVFRKLDYMITEELALSLSEKGEKHLFFANNLIDYRNGEEFGMYSNGSLYAAVFPYSVLIDAEDSWKPETEEYDFILSLDKPLIAAPEYIAKALLPSLPHYKAEKRNMMTITKDDFIKKERDARLKVLRTKSDFLSLFRLYRKTPEMRDGFSAAEDEINMENFMSRPYPFAAVALVENGKTLSGAYLSNEGKRNIMISGVATDPLHRGRGYACSVVSELIDIALNENMVKRLSLWYIEEETGRIYRSLGFRDTGSWIYLKKEE